MFQFFTGKNKKIICGVIIAILVLAMVIPLCVSVIF